MPSKKNPSKTSISKILKASIFDPRKPGPLSVITDVGSKRYFETRAIELIRENRLEQAISLLALAIANDT